MANEEELFDQDNVEPEQPLSEEDASNAEESAASEDENLDDLTPSSSDEKESALRVDDTEPDDGRAWYVIHCYSGYEKKVRHNLEQRIETMGMKDRIFDVVIPTQEEIEVREGKRRYIERHGFTGYVLVNMVLNEETCVVVRNTPGVTGFVGMANDPTPLRPEEVQNIWKEMAA